MQGSAYIWHDSNTTKGALKKYTINRLTGERELGLELGPHTHTGNCPGAIGGSIPGVAMETDSWPRFFILS